jgi:hypothetical protein
MLNLKLSPYVFVVLVFPDLCIFPPPSMAAGEICLPLFIGPALLCSSMAGCQQGDGKMNKPVPSAPEPLKLKQGIAVIRER